MAFGDDSGTTFRPLPPAAPFPTLSPTLGPQGPPTVTRGQVQTALGNAYTAVAGFPADPSYASPTPSHADVQDALNRVYAAVGGSVTGTPPPPSPSPSPSPSPPSSPPGDPFASDPGYVQARDAEQLGIPTIDGTVQDQIARRLTQFGDASFAAQAGFGVDPQAAAFARQNYLTGNAELARLDHAHALQRQAIINRLAGHGLLFSGDTGYLTGQEDQTYGNQLYDAQQRVLGDLYGYQQAGLSQKEALHAAKVTALEHAFDNAANHPGLYGEGTSNAAGTTTTANKTVTAPTASPKATRSAIVSQLRWRR